MTTKKATTKTTKAKATKTRKPAAKKATAKKAATRKKAATKVRTKPGKTPIEKWREGNQNAIKRLKNLYSRFDNFLNLHRWQFNVFMAIAIIMTIGVTVEHFESRWAYHKANGQLLAEEQRVERMAEKARKEMQKNKTAAIARNQVVTYKVDNFTRIHNADEDAFPVEYRNRLSEWAKEEGFDGIVFGRVQPMFDGGVKFATFSGKNEVPIKYVVEKLREHGCENVISVMGNKTEFWLPYPFTYQVNGDLKMYQTKGFSAAGFFNIIDPKIKFESENFEGTIDDGNLSVVLKDHKPWEGEVTKKNKKH